MSISQAGIYKLTLYENKGFTFLYNSDGTIDFDTISNTGDVLEFETNENSPKYSNNLVPAGNNNVLNDYLLSLEINGLIQSNLDTLEKLTSSIYGWIPLIEFMNNDKYLIQVPFFEKVNPFNSQVTHTFFVELKPAVFTTEKLHSVIGVGSEAVTGLLDFDGIDDYIGFTGVPDVTGDKIIPLNIYLPSSESGNNYINIANDASSDHLLLIIDNTGSESLIVQVTTGAGERKVYDISSYIDQELDVIIDKSANVINSVSVNGDVLSIQGTLGTNNLQEVFEIGRLNAGEGYIYGTGSYIWNVKIGSNPIYPGQPAGNLNPAWANGVNDGTVNGSPNTIDIP